MSILVNKDTEVIFQGITGTYGRYYSKQMIDCGTKVVAGVTPGKGGNYINNVPVYDTVKEARENHPKAIASVIFVPPLFTKEALLESLEAEIKIIVCIVEGVPVHDMMEVKAWLKESDSVLIGPNSPGIIVPEEFVAGFMPASAFKKGPVGIVSRSGTLTYQTSSLICAKGIGQSTCLGIGGDPIVGLSFVDVLRLFEQDEETKAVVLIGEIGGNQEENAAEYIKKDFSKPVIAYIAGRTAPPGKRMGHAGAIISGNEGVYASKVEALREAGVQVAEVITDVPKRVLASLAKNY